MTYDSILPLHEALAIAAKINQSYRRTLNRDVGNELHSALYDVLNSMVGKPSLKWTNDDLDNVELSAKAIGQVFHVGFNMGEREEPLWWDLHAYGK
jgi:hypothetical protein